MQRNVCTIDNIHLLCVSFLFSTNVAKYWQYSEDNYNREVHSMYTFNKQSLKIGSEQGLSMTNKASNWHKYEF